MVWLRKNMIINSCFFLGCHVDHRSILAPYYSSITRRKPEEPSSATEEELAFPWNHCRREVRSLIWRASAVNQRPMASHEKWQQSLRSFEKAPSQPYLGKTRQPLKFFNSKAISKCSVDPSVKYWTCFWNLNTGLLPGYLYLSPSGRLFERSLF